MLFRQELSQIIQAIFSAAFLRYLLISVCACCTESMRISVFLGAPSSVKSVTGLKPSERCFAKASTIYS